MNIESRSSSQLKHVFLYLFPQNKRELILFLALLTFFYSIALLFQLNTFIIDNPYRILDIMFSFDNPVMFHTGDTGPSHHPLLKYLMYPIQLSGLIAAKFWGYKAIGGVIVFSFSSFISLGTTYVHRYLYDIVNTRGYILWLLTSMYALFFTNLILCFITESYSFSIWLIPFVILFYSLYIKKGEEIKVSIVTIFTFLLGGITITNGIKPIIGYFFCRESLKKKLTSTFLIGLTFLAITSTILFFRQEKNLISNVNDRLIFADSKMNNLAAKQYENIIDLFLGSPILSSNVIEVSYAGGRFAVVGVTTGSKDSDYMVIVQDFFRYYWQYLWVAVLYILVLFSIAKNYKNIFMQMLLSFWIVDIVIHIIAGYGIGEGFIFGGHWVFIVPMILAWGYKSISKKWQPITFGILSVLCATMAINNLYQLYSTYQLGVKLFPSILPC